MASATELSNIESCCVQQACRKRVARRRSGAGPALLTEHAHLLALVVDVDAQVPEVLHQLLQVLGADLRHVEVDAVLL
jgi:hypothetical protein